MHPAWLTVLLVGTALACNPVRQGLAHACHDEEKQRGVVVWGQCGQAGDVLPLDIQATDLGLLAKRFNNDRAINRKAINHRVINHRLVARVTHGPGGSGS